MSLVTSLKATCCHTQHILAKKKSRFSSELRSQNVPTVPRCALRYGGNYLALREHLTSNLYCVMFGTVGRLQGITFPEFTIPTECDAQHTSLRHSPVVLHGIPNRVELEMGSNMESISLVDRALQCPAFSQISNRGRNTLDEVRDHTTVQHPSSGKGWRRLFLQGSEGFNTHDEGEADSDSSMPNCGQFEYFRSALLTTQQPYMLHASVMGMYASQCRVSGNHIDALVRLLQRRDLSTFSDQRSLNEQSRQMQQSTRTCRAPCLGNLGEATPNVC